MARALEVRRVRVSKVNPAAYNPRKDLQPGDPEYEALRRSMEEFGFVEPLVWNKRTGNLVGGHQRLKILVASGAREVDVSVVDLPLHREKALNVALNKVGGDWDLPKLGELLKELQAMPDIDETVTGFSQREIDALFRELEPPTPEPDGNLARATEAAKALKVARGQVWQLGRHRLMCGNCTEGADVARLTSGIEMDAVVTDPPYGIGREGIPNDDEAGTADLYRRALATLPVRNAAVAAFQSPRLFPTWVDAARGAGHAFHRALFMYKPDDETFPWRGWIGKTEMILLTTVGQGRWYDLHPYQHDVYTVSVSRIVREHGQVAHPTVKSLEVTRDLLQRVCPPGRAVFDGFAGSGTTLIAAEQTGRTCYAMEIEPRYCAVAIARWELYTGQKARLSTEAKPKTRRRALARD